MASNNSSGYGVVHVAENAKASHCFSRESEDNTLLAMSSLAKMEATRGARQHADKDGRLQQDKATKSTSDGDDSTNCLDIVQQAISAVEDTLLRCTRHARYQALSELLTRAKLERARKVSQTHVLATDYLEHATVWAAMLQHVQGLGHDYPKDPQVHQLVYLVQQCVSRIKDYEGPEEDDDRTSLNSCEDIQQQEFEGDDVELCGRMGEISVDVEVTSDDEEVENERDDNEDESNQLEDESDDVDARQKFMDDQEKSTSCAETEIEDVEDSVDQELASSKNSTPPTRLRELLPILTANIVVKGVQVPCLPRGSFGITSTRQENTSSAHGLMNSTPHRSSRLKFQFPENELPSHEDKDAKRSSNSARSPGQQRRINQSSTITGMVPLRRQSFSMKRSPLKSSSFSIFSPKRNTTGASTADSPGVGVYGKQRWTARRKSTSSCHTNAGQSSVRPTSKGFSFVKHVVKTTAAASPNKPSVESSSPPSPKPTTQSQIVLRVRERSRDGVPELVISKKPIRFIAWHWNDRCFRAPFMNAANIIELGPAQHGIMLRQLRYVKSVMHDLPWAKSHLRALLSKYTAKDVSKEELYPQLNVLGLQVQREMSDRAKQHRALTARKQRLTVTLTMATNVVNDTIITKFGRRGRPHASRLLYDPTTPLQLRWRRKHGERSVEFLLVDEIQVVEVPEQSPRLSSSGAGAFGRGNKKAAAAVAVDPETCLSLVTPSRSLDLQVASALHREWLANAVRDIVSFAQQFKAARANACTPESSHARDLIPNSTALVRQRHAVLDSIHPRT